MLSTPRVGPRAAPASASSSEALPRITFGCSSTSFAAVRVRYGVAPQPTGSSTQGLDSARARNAARSMAATQGGDRVPMLTTSALAIATKSSTSASAWTIAGAAPIASRQLATTSIETKLVMLWTSGTPWRSACSLVQLAAA